MTQNIDSILSFLKGYTLEDCLLLEQNDPQFLSIQSCIKIIKKQDIYSIPLINSIIINSLICYQLSLKGEIYWEEFCSYLINNIKYYSDKEFNYKLLFIEFFKVTKGNKRLQVEKLKRVDKIIHSGILFQDMKEIEYYYKNQEIFLKNIAEKLHQKITDKTILFALKIFSYIARVLFTDKISFIPFPKDILLPIDSRIKRITKLEKNKEIILFWKEIQEKLDISLLHLDVVLWQHFDGNNKD